MTLTEPFRKPRVDDNQYRLVTLANNIQALLIHDPAAEKAAAAVDVRVGSLSDPEDVPGLAHFTEHMLFYSSEKYPEEDAYSKFVSEHGGHTNAYTSNESTNYHFDCNADALPQALDRFAQFFVAPQISADGVEREVNAVDSEHSKNINSDSWRKLQLWKATANPAHPFSRFSTGSLDTLLTAVKAAGQDPAARVRQFYREHYAAVLMKVVVLGKHSLDELETMVKEGFDPVVDRHENAPTAPASFGNDAVTGEQLGRLIKNVPVRDTHTIEIQWPTVSEQQHYRAAPSHYVSHLLGHEGEGSAFALLKKLGWASGLVAGEASTSYSSRSFFMCRVDLTDEGNRHVADVIAIIFRYLLKVINAPDGVNKRVWDEMHALASLRFEYRDKPNPYDYVSLLSHGMHIYDPEHLLLASYAVPLRYDEDLIRQVVSDLTPENARFLWSSRALAPECTSTEKWYGTAYTEEPVPAAWMDAWRNGDVVEADALSSIENGQDVLYLPALNDFIPDNLSLVEESVTAPFIAAITPLTRLWLRPEPTFRVPKAVAYLHVILPESYTSPSAAVQSQLLAKLINDALSESTYPAELAGAHYGCRATVQGLLLTLSGFHDSLSRLAELVLSTAFGMEAIDPERFALMKEKLARDYSNMRLYDQPYSIGMYELSVALEARRWHVSDYETVLQGLNSTDLSNFLPRLLSTARIESYVAGNLPQQAAEQLVQDAAVRLEKLRGTLPLSTAQLPEARVVALRPGRPALLRLPGPNPADANSAVVVAFQVAPDDARMNALAELVAHIGKREAFHQLRTVEQLGYLTFFTSYWTLTVRNLAFFLQSPAKSASFLESRVEAFLPLLRDRLAAMSPEEFETQVKELAKSKLEKPKRLREVASRDWREVDDGTLRFDRQQEEVKHLERLTPGDLLSFFVEHVSDAATRRKITVRIEAAQPEEEEEEDDEASSSTEIAAATETAPGSAKGAPSNGASAVIGKAQGEREGETEYVDQGVELIQDVFEWKRKQSLYPSFR